MTREQKDVATRVVKVDFFFSAVRATAPVALETKTKSKTTKGIQLRKVHHSQSVFMTEHNIDLLGH